METLPVLTKTWTVTLLCFIFSPGIVINGLSYDHFATTKCLNEPRRALYGGGIIGDSEFANGVKGNKYIIVKNRTRSTDSLLQTVRFQEGMLYSFSAWVQIRRGNESAVAVVFRIKMTGKLIRGGQVFAKKGCWSFLKGGIQANFSGPVEILCENNNTVAEIWIASVTLKPFAMEEWRSHQDSSIEKVRKRRMKFQVTYANGTRAEGAVVSIKQTRQDFPFGCGMNHNILTSTDYQNWFSSRFKHTTFTNEMKWYSTEKIQGQENYSVPDAMLDFAKQNGISVRGHNIFWDDPKFQPHWVKTLAPDELREAAKKRIDSVVSRYSGKLIAWDVVNENLHFTFFEDKLGKNVSAEYFSRAHELDPGTTMFMNEYNTIEYSSDQTASPENYIKRMDGILSYPGNQGIPAAIGVQGNFGPEPPDLAYMRSSLDILASSGLPIWLTEVSMNRNSNQAEYFEQVLREAYCHPGVKGIIMFAGPKIAGFNVTTLVDEEFKNTPVGDVVDKLIKEWKSDAAEIKTDRTGFFEISLHHGDYDFAVKHPLTNSLSTLSYKVEKDVGIASIVNIKIES